MRNLPTTRQFRRLAILSLSVSGLAAAASAQVSFSVDWHSPTVGMPASCTGVPITEGDILVPLGFAPAIGPLPAPCVGITAGVPGLSLAFYGACVGHPGGIPCRIEVDALSYGTDLALGPNTVAMEEYLFSTDEFATGGVPPILAPSIATEAPFGDSSADVWRQGAPLPPGPVPPFGGLVGHRGAIDGNGLVSGSGAVYPGTGLIEPNFPGFPNTGDNLDALDYNQASTGTPIFPATGVFFSMDATFTDFISGTPNTGSAIAHGFTGADILHVAFPGALPVVFAPGPALGLNLINMQEDDLDALAIWENGSGIFEPSKQPYDWNTGASDMVLFSVRRGSPVVGMPDSIFGIPISEGDILTTPLPTVFGGVSPYPGIFCAAENIGLIARVASALADDLNALDTVQVNIPITDCNGNGTADAIDIASGTSSDCNLNGIPDECEPDCNGNGIPDDCDIFSGTSSDINFNGIPDDCEVVGSPSCFCDSSAPAPCGNFYPSAGCRNSTGIGAGLTVAGTSSVTLDDLVLNASGMPGSVPAIFFGGTAAVGPLPFGDGLRCAGGFITRFTAPALTTASGDLNAGPGLASGFGISVGDFWNFQCWFRDPSGPCSNGYNTTNAYSATFTL
jgi:hypothetical protein